MVNVANDFGVEVVGAGAARPLLLIHSAVTFEGTRPLLLEPTLSDRGPVVHYWRRGYRLPPPSSGDVVEQHAMDAAAVLRSIGVSSADVLGHSIGALIALQLALDSPALVRSVILVEPTWPTRPELLRVFEAAMMPIVEAYQSGQRQVALDRLMNLLDGETYRERLSTGMPDGWFERSAAALDVYFRSELPAASLWRLDEGRASLLIQPTLIVTGAESPPVFHDVARDARMLLPHVGMAVIPGASHNVIAGNTRKVARTIAGFLGTLATGNDEASS